MAEVFLFTTRGASLDSLLRCAAVARALESRGHAARVLSGFERTAEVERWVGGNLVWLPGPRFPEAWPRYARMMAPGTLVLDGVEDPGADVVPAEIRRVWLTAPATGATGSAPLLAPDERPGFDWARLGPGARKGLLGLVGRHSPWLDADPEVAERVATRLVG